MSYAYCDQPHPGSDAEARAWCERYHRPTVPTVDRCPHPYAERIERTGHGHLGDYTGTHVLCAGCGHDFGAQA